jgi:hypothetical protein
VSNIPSTTTTTTNNYSKQDIKPICDAYGCCLEAIDTINVDGGLYGTITLSLCSSCKNKFNSENKNGNR